jgi:hypothetical protein
MASQLKPWLFFYLCEKFRDIYIQYLSYCFYLNVCCRTNLPLQFGQAARINVHTLELHAGNQLMLLHSPHLSQALHICAALCVVEWQTTTLEVNDGLIMGRCGLIKKRTLSSPMSKIQYCEYTTFLCFNKIRINCISGQFTYKNMKGAKQFVDLVQSNINN